ncbi:Crp/Fnr family transcriptional regulator [Aporhodopirellula aestuarii]|uniref:Crp/Fnr family transcriptional regulator n=1 Tax=Aporhodopirellula aestuarii TaxID=2950107 RepID=A0ABT0U7H1_9BACT|nr:Crp/Fnr family transcriptional regulator [Aporhodopirellula aestuarii]MCM2372368.1 Crp/Fnr family transcriptional regulator [Aporhodopirellula aestuarii]
MSHPIISRSCEEVIRASELLGGLDDCHQSALAAISLTMEFPQDHRVMSQDQECPGIYLVDSGLVRVFRVGPRGQQHVLHLCGPGQSFAEVAAFGHFPLPANATAVQRTRCVLIPIDALHRELASNHELCRQMLTSMSLWVRHFVQMLDDIVLRDAMERVARLLCDVPCDRMGRLKLPGPKKDIANHLNLTSETFSRVLRRLNEQGVLDVDSERSIRVIDAEQLAQISAPAS